MATNREATQNPELLFEEQRVQTPCWTFQLLRHSLKIWPLNTSNFENNGPCILRPTRLKQLEKLLWKVSYTWTRTPQGPAQRQPIILRFKVKELLILKLWPEEQTSNLKHTYRSLLEDSLGMETSRCFLLLSCSRAPVSPRAELLYTSGILIVVPAS